MRHWPHPDDTPDTPRGRLITALEFWGVALLSLAALATNVGIPTERMSEWFAAIANFLR